MYEQDSTANFGVKITSESLASQWVNAQSLRFGKQLAAIQSNARPSSLFVENELLVDFSDTDTLQWLVEKYDATIIPPEPVPAPPEGMNRERMRSIEGMPVVVKVQFNGEMVSLDPLEKVAAAQMDRQLQVTSRAGAGTLALATHLHDQGRSIMPNYVGEGTLLPLRSSTEGAGFDRQTDAYQYPEYAGPSNITRAWQLLDAYSRWGNVSPDVFLAIFDAGFNINNVGGLNPDFPNGVLQWNLIDNSPNAGGPNDEAERPWHGNAVLSAAAAPIDNQFGAAGVAGLRRNGLPFVQPFVFKTFRETDEIFRGLKNCVAWGIDVINMSFSLKRIAFPYLWESTFQFAADQGVIVIAAAGNEDEDLPELDIRPATRTPGVITVGALDTYAPTLTRASFSNYGSSVDIWAPGINIHIMPYPDPEGKTYASGTSIAAPIVAGVVAMMKVINPALKSVDVKQILRDTGHKNSPDKLVTVALNAYEALLRTMGGSLPDFDHNNNTPQTAIPLFPRPDGILAPDGDTILANGSDQDWYSFEIDDYHRLIITLDYIPELSKLSVELLPEEPNSLSLSTFTVSNSNGRQLLEVGQLAPGKHRLQVRGNGPNIYELNVKLTPNPLTPDIFEANNTFETAALIRMSPTPKTELDIFRGFGPGVYQANLHLASDIDFFHVTRIKELGNLIKTTFSILAADRPLDITFFDSNGKPLPGGELVGLLTTTFRLPAPECWIRISSSKANRYIFKIYDELDESVIPGPLQKVKINPIPKWLPDPPFVLHDWEQFFAIEVTEELKEIGKLGLTAKENLTLELIAPTGSTLVEGVANEQKAEKALELDLSNVPTGTHVLRVGRNLPQSARLNPALSKRLATFNLNPVW